MDDQILHPAVRVTVDGSGGTEFRDERTGLAVTVAGLAGPPGRELSDEIRSFFASAGFDRSLPLDDLRRIQRPIRRHLQEAQREEQLQEQLAFARASSAYYRERPAYAEDRALGGMPCLTKQDLRSHFGAMLADGVDLQSGIASGRLAIARTSGTTSERVQVFSDTTLSRVPPDYEQVWGLDGLDPLPRTAVLTSPVCSATECRLGRSSMAERVKFGTTLFLNSTDDLFSAPDTLIHNVFQELWDYRPHLLYANPVYLHWFLLRADALGLEAPPIAAVLSTYQYLSTIQRRCIERRLRCPVFNVHTATELAGSMVAVECRFGTWHVREDHVFVECDAGPGGEGGPGPLLVTTMNRVLPLIRYDVGDLVRVRDVDCPCTLSDWQTIEFHGRRSDAIHLRGRVVTTRDVDHVVGGIPGVAFYQLRQTGSASVAVSVIPDPDGALDTAEARLRIGHGLGIEPGDVQIMPVSRLEPEVSMKFRLVVPLGGGHGPASQQG